MPAPSFAQFLAPDRSVGDWLRRHLTYWLLLIGLLTFLWAYWAASWPVALQCVLVLLPLEYLPATYLLLYWVLPALLQNRPLAVTGRLLVWVATFFGLRFGLQQAGLVVGSVPGLVVAPWRALFDASFMATNNLVIVAAMLKLFRHYYQREQAHQQLAQQTLAEELKLLKAQLQPHFLFNTLNNIYSLALRQSPQAGPTVRKLAELLHQLFGAEEASEVPLRQEVQLLRHYVELEQLRYGARLRVQLRLTGELGGQRVAPLLLLPFVENAFKHGVAALAGPVTLEIILHATADSLHVLLANDYDPAATRAAGPGGLGLPNVRQRLALLYPGRHSLRIQAGAARYQVELRIPLVPAPAARRQLIATPALLVTNSLPTSC